MYQKFINQCDSFLSRFKETGEIEYLLHLEAQLSSFLDNAIEDYLDETNDSCLSDENTSNNTLVNFHLSYIQPNWTSDDTSL